MNALVRATAAEWRKLQRPGMLLGGLGTMVGIAALVTALIVFVSTNDPVGGPSNPQGFSFTGPGGLVLGLSILANLLGTVSLVLFAQSMGSEYGQGTLKVMLTREPRRVLFLAGKVLGMSLFVLLGVLLAALAQGISAGIITKVQGLDISAWWTADALLDDLLVVLRVWIGCVVWGLLGTTLAVTFRSAPAAIGTGLVYGLVVEGLVSLVATLNGADWAKWLPGNALASFASRAAGAQTKGPFAMDLLPASLAVAIYASAFLAVASLLLHRRDVST